MVLATAAKGGLKLLWRSSLLYEQTINKSNETFCNQTSYALKYFKFQSVNGFGLFFIFNPDIPHHLASCV